MEFCLLFVLKCSAKIIVLFPRMRFGADKLSHHLKQKLSSEELYYSHIIGEDVKI